MSDTEELTEACNKFFKQIAEGWRNHGFNNTYHVEFDARQNPELVPAFNLLKSKGLIKQHGAGHGCELTQLGQHEARKLLGV